MDICDFFRRDTLSDQFVTNIIIYAEVTFFFKRFYISNRFLIFSIVCIFALNLCFPCCLMRNTQITEDDLRKLVLSRFRVDTGNILNTAVELCFGAIFKGRINQTRI